MLSEFITIHRDAIVAQTRERVRDRSWPSVAAQEIEHAVPLFLSLLSDTLRREATADPLPIDAIGPSAARRGAELLAGGFNVSQVVHDYGNICQAITQVAIDEHAPITVEEFHTLNLCLDTAIADAVTEYTRLTAQKRSEEEVGRLGHAAHELRDHLNAAVLAFHALKRGTVPINGSTGAVLGRSLTSLGHLVDRRLSEVRLAAGTQRRERIRATTLVDDIAATSMLHAEDRNIRLTVSAVDPGLVLDADPQLLTSAVMNLLHNAFKNTPAGGAVTLKTQARGDRLIVAVEDQCGGIPGGTLDLFTAFGNRRGADRSGLGLGLSIARQAVQAHGGEIHVRNRPGTGCVFEIDVPLAADERRTPESRVSVSA